MAQKRKRKVVKAAKRRLVFFGTISIAAIIYFFVTLATYTIRIAELSQEKKELAAQMVTLKDDEENLKLEIQKLQDPDYIARFARENYLYSKDGEYIIKLDDQEKEKETEEKVDWKDYKYVFIGGGVFVIILVIWLIKKVNEK